MAVEAVIFDMDGTLVDTNAAHVEAWRRAFEKGGFAVEAGRIAPEIGKGGDKLVPSVLDEATDREHGDDLRESNGDEFLKIAGAQQFAVFPQADELLAALHERGLKVALATSAKKEYLEAIEKSAGIDLQGLADLVITADDAEQSKPAPDLVLATVRKLGLSPAKCVMVGDTPHDAEACRRAGVSFVGVRTGGHTEAALTGAGARAVWDDVSDLLAHLDEALLQVSSHED